MCPSVPSRVDPKRSVDVCGEVLLTICFPFANAPLQPRRCTGADVSNCTDPVLCQLARGIGNARDQVGDCHTALLACCICLCVWNLFSFKSVAVTTLACGGATLAYVGVSGRCDHRVPVQARNASVACGMVKGLSFFLSFFLTWPKG